MGASSWVLSSWVVGCLGAAGPGGAPFRAEVLAQPVPGAARGLDDEGWRVGKQCIVTAMNGSNATLAIQGAIDACGGLEGGGTVVIPAGTTLSTASLWLRSNLTLRVEGSLVHTANGRGDRTGPGYADAPVVYTRRESTMGWAHAGLLNGGRCLRLKEPLVGWDDCAEWSKLSNVVVEGPGTVDGDGAGWFEASFFDPSMRPMLLDLLWVDGLTIRDLKIRRPAYWTVHPTFSNNVRVTGNSIVTLGPNTDGCDPDSCWNVFIGANDFDTGDDCIAIKAGRDWSGRRVNISTHNVLAAHNTFKAGHGVSIGSETAAWVTNVTIRDSVLNGTRLAVRIKSKRGRGGGVAGVLYENLTGTVEAAIQLTLNYDDPEKPTNDTATPVIRDVTVRHLRLDVVPDATLSSKPTFLECTGLDDSEIDGVTFRDIKVRGSSSQTCADCRIDASRDVHPAPNNCDDHSSFQRNRFADPHAATS